MQQKISSKARYYVQNERARQTLRHYVQKAVLRKLLLATRWIHTYNYMHNKGSTRCTLLGLMFCLRIFFSLFLVRIACTFPHKSRNINVLHNTYQIARQNICIYAMSRKEQIFSFVQVDL